MKPCRQLVLVVGQAGPVDVRLYILVEVFVGIQFRGMTRQEEQLDPPAMLIHPVPHLLAVVGAEAVGYQIDLLGGLLQQSLQEQDEQRRVHGA